VVQRLQEAETSIAQAEAAARAAGMVAQSVMGELLSAREEAASALQFISGKGLEREFRSQRGEPSAAEAAWDREIEETLARQLSGELDLSEGRVSERETRVDLGGGAGDWDVPVMQPAKKGRKAG
jgi:hypothetical protein